MLLTVVLAVSGMTDVAPPCSVTAPQVAVSLRQLPAAVRSALADRLADRGAPFNVTDSIPADKADLPFQRLICGYLIPQGYVVERERGGRGYSIGKIVFNQRAGRYVERR